MTCLKCKKEFSADYKSCPHCGTRIAPTDPSYLAFQRVERETPVYEDLAQTPAARSAATMALVFGIISIAMTSLLGIGIIFGILARVYANKFEQIVDDVYGMAKVGKILGLVGIILGALNLVWLFAQCAMFSSRPSYYYY